MLFSSRSRRGSTTTIPEKVPFPARQLFVLALCRICEPIAFMSIFPYIYYMILSFNITSDDRQIAIYAGMVTSAFAFAEFSTGVMWGRLSDRVGRKPILLTGLAGTGLSMLIFGFATNLPVALLARALGGLLNGNIGVLQTTVAEVVTVEAHQPRAYAIMPFIWCLGSIIGSGLGGTLAEPVKSYPSAFRPGSVWETYPYLLPNLVCASVVVAGLVIGILFLEETHEDKRSRRDYGLELGNWLLSKLQRTPAPAGFRSKDALLREETLSFLSEDDPPPRYRSIESPPALARSRMSEDAASLDCRTEKPKASVRRAFTPQVLLNIVAYGILAFHTISFEQLMPVLLASPEPSEPASLPFKFTGGFALPTKDIGFILSVQGLLQMFVQLFVFPVVNRRFGSLFTFRLVVVAYPVLYFVTPYLALVPDRLRMVGVYAILVWKVTAQSLAYPSNNIMLANSAPSKKVLGTLNGVAASAASLCRAFGPTVSGFIQSAGLRVGYSGLSWWSCALVALVGAAESLWMSEERRRFGERSCQAERDQETGAGEPQLGAVSADAAIGACGSLDAEGRNGETNAWSGGEIGALPGGADTRRGH